ncbi:MAG: hypothetical protein OK455_09625, partial [Thaumarchaeota archaeon]|nr:hypothetical protein [Nitrososphaerota archaeon]
MKKPLLAASVLLLLALSSLPTYTHMQTHQASAASAGSSWTGQYSGRIHQSDASGTSVDTTDSGQIVFDMSKLSGNGSGHLDYNGVSSTPVPCTVAGNVDYNYTFNVGLDTTSGNVTFIEGAFSPEYIPLHVVSGCGGGGQVEQVPAQLYAPATNFAKVKLEEGAMWHFASSAPPYLDEEFNGTIHGATCPVSLTSKFEPVQAVFQDDDLFPDSPGKQLTIVDKQHLTAELPMVVDKTTVLMGTRGDRQEIKITGNANGSVLVPVSVRFTLTDPSGNHVIDEWQSGMRLPLEGGCGKPTPFTISIPTTLGIPEQPFTIDQPGGYSITMQLIGQGGKVVSGDQVTLSGVAKTVQGLAVQFLPVYLNRTGAAQSASLLSAAGNMKSNSRLYVPDFYPLAPGSFRATSSPTALNWTDLSSQALGVCGSYGSCYTSLLNVDAVREGIAAGWLSGNDRIVIVLDPAEFAALGVPNAVAFTDSTKVIFMQTAVQDAFTVSHEVAHTLPRFAWLADTQVNGTTTAVEDCGVPFHNTGAYGNGLQVTLGGFSASSSGSSRALKLGLTGIMGPAESNKWIEQCTYWHLISALNSHADPTVLGVRGWMLNNAGKQTGGLDPGFTLQGSSDLNATGNGPYSLIFKDQGGNALAKYDFNATFATDDGVPVGGVEFGYRVVMPQGSNELDLLGPDGPLASRTIPQGSPSVTITTANGDHEFGPTDPVTVNWKGSGQNLTYSLLVSPNNGTDWYPVILDSGQTSATIDRSLFTLGNVGVLAKVVATD